MSMADEGNWLIAMLIGLIIGIVLGVTLDRTVLARALTTLQNYSYDSAGRITQIMETQK